MAATKEHRKTVQERVSRNVTILKYLGAIDRPQHLQWGCVKKPERHSEEYKHPFSPNMKHGRRRSSENVGVAGGNIYSSCETQTGNRRSAPSNEMGQVATRICCKSHCTNTWVACRRKEIAVLWSEHRTFQLIFYRDIRSVGQPYGKCDDYRDPVPSVLYWVKFRWQKEVEELGDSSFHSPWSWKKKRLTDTASQSELLNWQNGKSIALYANSTFLHITSAWSAFTHSPIHP